MADTKLILQIDNLDHKLISVDSEVAVNETFDIVFEGLSETEEGAAAKIELHTLSRKELVWVLEERIGRIEEGALGILDCKINTQNALDITRITSAKTILTLVLTDDYGNRTVYGTAQMRLHPGYGEGGEPLVEIERSVEKHDVDPEAHKKLFQSLRDADESILQEVDGKIVDSKNAEVEARNNAIRDAVNQAKDDMANSYKGDLTNFANAAASSARAAASSANAAAIAAGKTVEKIGEANEVVNTLNGKISQVDSKVEVVGRYAESAEGAAGRANRSAERAVGAEENIGVYVTQVSGLAAGIKQDTDRAANVVGTVNDAKVAVETAKRQVEGLAEEVGGYKQTAVNAASAASQSASNAEGSANTAKGHADRAEGAAGRANNYVNIELPNKVAILDQSIDDKMSAVDAHLESAQTAILSNIDNKANEVSTAIDGKVTEANDAKTDAVKAKDDAVTAKGQAEGFAKDASESAESASKSATASATSASQAKTTADSLSAGLATLNGLDGRVKKLEDGRGAWKDPSTGKVYYYNVCPVGDGTLVQLQTTGGIDRFTLVEGLPNGATPSISRVSGDCFVIFCDGKSYVYDKTFNRVGKVDGSYAFTMYHDGFVYCFTSKMVQKRNVTGATSGNADAATSLNTARGFIAFNPKSGHIVAGSWENNEYNFYIYDLDLNELEVKTGKLSVDWGYSPNHDRRICNIWVTKHTVFFQDYCFGYENAQSCTLFMLDDTDTPVVVHESLPAFDEATGKTILEKDANGNLVKEGRLYKPVVTTEKIRIKSREQIEKDRVSTTSYYNILTPYTDRHGNVYLTNLVDEYAVFADGTIVDTYRYCKDDRVSTSPNYSATKRTVTSNVTNNSAASPRLTYLNAGTDITRGGVSEATVLVAYSDNGSFSIAQEWHREASGGGTTMPTTTSPTLFANKTIAAYSSQTQTANGARYGLWGDLLFKHQALCYGGAK